MGGQGRAVEADGAPKRKGNQQEDEVRSHGIRAVALDKRRTQKSRHPARQNDGAKSRLTGHQSRGAQKGDAKAQRARH